MNVLEMKFSNIVRRHRDSVSAMVAGSPASEIVNRIHHEAEAIREQSVMMNPDDEIIRNALARIVALVVEADTVWYRD